ncbi:MAG: pitrilysin family protein [Chloroflexi bacterium]|nr:pitrilysin family protein [Chloroflexota bacterium]
MLNVPFEKFRLSNGLEVVLHHQPGLPLTAVNLWYHVGSKNETPGRTGFAHLFEHLMFEGSGHHRRSFFLPLQQAGATLNGSTSSDRTNYWENVPANYLELALWLEADRLGFLLDAVDDERLEVQRAVVKNERRQSYENRPYGGAQELLRAALYPPQHPYHWMVIGSQEDLDAATLSDVQAFFRRYYTPTNASLVIAGHFDPDVTRTMVERLFGDIPGGPPLPRTLEWVPPLSGDVRLTTQDRVRLPRLYWSWPAPAAFDKDEPALDLLGSILGDGRSSRLYRSLIYDKSIAQEAAAYNHAEEIAGEFGLVATASAGHTLDEVAEAAEAELERLRSEPPTEAELRRAINRMETQFMRRLEQIGGFGGRADLLNHFNVYTGDPGRLMAEMDRYLAVTPADIHRVARAVLSGPRVRLEVPPLAETSVSLPIDRSVVPEPAAPLAFVPPVPQRVRLSNGLDLVVVEYHAVPVVAALGTRLSALVYREHTMISTHALTKHWPSVLKLLADVVLHPTFPEHEMQRVRRDRLTELRRRKEDASATADKVATLLLHGAETPLGHALDGTEAGLEAVTRDDLVAHAARLRGVPGATLILVGDLTLAEAVAQAEAAFAGWAPGDGTVSPTAAAGPFGVPGLYLVDKPGAPQSVIRTVHPTIPRRDPDYLALLLLNWVFGGQFTARLNMNLRQSKGYSYGYNSRVEWRSAVSQFMAGGSVQTAVTREALSETLKEFAELLGDRPVSAEELDLAKAGFTQGLPRGFETPQQIVEQMADLVRFNLPEDTLATLADNVVATPLADVQRVATQQLGGEGMIIVVVGDRAEIEPGLRELGLPLRLIDDEGRPVTE